MNGKWKVGIYNSVVVSDTKVQNTNFPSPPNPTESRDEDKDYYGGYLVCESVGSLEMAKLIAAAPEMLDALRSIVNYWNSPNKESLSYHINHSLIIAAEAIKKATE